MPRGNCVLLLRLALALVVLIGHAWPLGGFGAGPSLGPNGAGPVAVLCFFALSGYLITKSRQRLPAGRFMWHRSLRIMPAFWLALLLVAFVMAPLVGHTGAGDGLTYVRENWLLRIHDAQQFAVGGTPTRVPYDAVWNGSLYTLEFEFFWYLVLAATGRWLLRPARVASALIAVTAVSAAGWFPMLLDPWFVVTFGAPFLAGSLLALLDWQPSWRVAGASGLFAAGMLAAGDRGALCALPLAVAVIWVARLPAPVTWTADLSYGIYVLAFPIQQVLAAYHVQRLGLVMFAVAGVAAVLPAAYLSWRLVEAPALGMKNLRRRMPLQVAVGAGAAGS